MTCAVGVVFTFTVFIFFVYDRLVERRQRLLMRKTVQTHKIVSSLFPKNIRDRLLEEAEDSDKHKKSAGLLAPNQRLKTFLNGDGKEDQSVIADLFPHSTVLFADICGFTAWSSTREPAQVFTLLETVYQAFDYIAKVRKVFKVETIGDSVSFTPTFCLFVPTHELSPQHTDFSYRLSLNYCVSCVLNIWCCGACPPQCCSTLRLQVVPSHR